LEDILAIQVPRGSNTASAQDAPVSVQVNIGMRGIHLSVGEQIGKPWSRDTESIGQGLQFTISALFAEHAVVVTLHKQHVNDIPSKLCDLFGIAFNIDAFGYRLGAGGLAFSIDQHSTDPAASLGLQIFMVAKPWNIFSRGVGCFHDREAGVALDNLTVQYKSDFLTHCNLHY
jgi:hypothetical protein